MENYVISKLKETGPYNKTGFLATRQLNLTEASAVYADQDISAYFVDGFADLLSPIALSAAWSNGLMGYHGIPQMPLFVYKAIHDEISPIADTDALVDRFCGVGANILYRRNTNGTHTLEAYYDHAAAASFIDAVLLGTYAQNYNTTGCTIQNVTVSITL